MIKFAIIILTLLTLIAPIVAVLLIIDWNKKSVVPLLLGGVLFTIAEACIVLPVINYLGYNIFFVIIGIIIIEVLRYLVLGIYLKRTGYKDIKVIYFFAGYLIVNLFVVWGVDAVATASVIFLSDFGFMEAGEIWISLLLAMIKAVMVYSYTALAAIAVKQKKARYIFMVIGIHILSDENMIFELCDILNIDTGFGVMLLAIIACVMLVVTDKMSHLWKGNSNED